MGKFGARRALPQRSVLVAIEFEQVAECLRFCHSNHVLARPVFGPAGVIKLAEALSSGKGLPTFNTSEGPVLRLDVYLCLSGGPAFGPVVV